ncbi:MAG TPA: methyltransferase domain-containing protein [Lacunisphaera sp.]|nr:methyltransferase domain-containing protein [Lacunisphaera sp.]
MFSIKFACNGSNHVLNGGERFAAPREHGFRDTPSADLLSLVAEIDSGRPWREVVNNRYAATKPWLHRIITHPSRTAFFDQVLPAGSGLALDIGAGWGQTCRALAVNRPVVAIEPVAERLAFLQSAAKQDGVADRLACIGTDYFDLSFEDRFTAICAIGVLEWVGAFQDRVDPQERQLQFLRKARSELAPDGVLVLGIENRLGLKYLLGCPDDHIGAARIACLPASLARARWRQRSGQVLQSFTYSLDELTHMLRTAGFRQIDFFGAFPDYKLPGTIISLGVDGHETNAWLLSHEPVPEHNGYDGTSLSDAFQQNLRARYRELAARGVAHHFVPSFFVRAG